MIQVHDSMFAGAPAPKKTARFAVLFLAATALVASCASPRPLPEPTTAAAAPWAGAPLSWAKLADIEAWLEGPGSNAAPDEVAEARLEWADGLSSFVLRDAQVASGTVLEQRRQRAALLYRQVRDDAGAIAVQRTRARLGLERMSGGPIELPKAAPTSDMRFIGRALWGAQPAIPSRMTRAAPPWSRVTVHHTAMPAAHLRSAALEGSAAELRQIQKNHIHAESWGDIGYHFLIDPAGRVFEGRQMQWQGAHAGGTNNEHNIGICLLGNFQSERPTREALGSLERLVDDLSKRHRIPRRQVFGHQDFKSTECPGVHLYNWVRAYKRGSLSSSSIASTDHLGHQPSACSLCAAPTIAVGSPARTSVGSAAID